MSIEVTRNCEVIVRVPNRVSDTSVNEFVENHSEWIKKALIKVKAKAEANPEPTDDELKHYRKLAKEMLPDKVVYYSEIMGVTPTSVKITSAKTRFGSCSSKNAICFSARLMAYDQAAIDYVVVHELAHIKYHNHSKQFYGFIESVMPDWKERNKLLKK